MKINIHKHTAGILRALGLDPHLVRSLTITPSSVDAEVFLTDENGAKYLVPAGSRSSRHVRR